MNVVMTTRMRQVSLNMGLLQLAITSLSVLVSHSTHQQEFQFTRLSVWTLKQKTKSLQRERERERESLKRMLLQYFVDKAIYEAIKRIIS